MTPPKPPIFAEAIRNLSLKVAEILGLIERRKRLPRVKKPKPTPPTP